MKKTEHTAGSLRAVAPDVSPESLVAFGQGKFAYIRSMTQEEARKTFPAADTLPTTAKIYVLFAADGSFKGLHDDKGQVTAFAWSCDLEVVPLH